MSRPSWDEYFAKLVVDAAARSTCIRRQFGAIVVNDKKEIISTGYNGVVRGAPHCEEIGCIKDEMSVSSGMGHGICPAVHAEQNALLQAGKQARNATLYINGFPCKICARLIVNAGIMRIVVSGSYSDEEGLKILHNAGVEVTYLNSHEWKDEKDQLTPAESSAQGER
ncbi:MAG: cytidine/deoxycytidylate deaminase family protein [Candidatus Hydrothermarchaeales archaeon]